MSMLKVICAWCGKDLGEKDGEGQEGISHGVCDKCYAKVLRPVRKRSRKEQEQ